MPPTPPWHPTHRHPVHSSQPPPARMTASVPARGHSSCPYSPLPASYPRRRPPFCSTPLPPCAHAPAPPPPSRAPPRTPQTHPSTPQTPAHLPRNHRRHHAPRQTLSSHASAMTQTSTTSTTSTTTQQHSNTTTHNEATQHPRTLPPPKQPHARVIPTPRLVARLKHHHHPLRTDIHPRTPRVPTHPVRQHRRSVLEHITLLYMLRLLHDRIRHGQPRKFEFRTMPENVPVASTGRCVCTVVDYRVYVDVTHTTLFAFASSEDHLVGRPPRRPPPSPGVGLEPSGAGPHLDPHGVSHPPASIGWCVCVCIGVYRHGWHPPGPETQGWRR